jgi:hypothetical protein
MNQKQPEAGHLPKLSAPARRALEAAGIYRLEQLTTVRETDIARLHGIGPNALRQLRRALAANGLAFAAEP